MDFIANPICPQPVLCGWGLWKRRGWRRSCTIVGRSLRGEASVILRGQLLACDRHHAGSRGPVVQPRLKFAQRVGAAAGDDLDGAIRTIACESSQAKFACARAC